MTTAKRNVIITDLDQSDTQIRAQEDSHRKVHRKRTSKLLNTISDNFNRRSHSAEGLKGDRFGKPATKPGYLNELLLSKEQQMEKLIQRLTTLHKFNEQFADQNQRLTEETKSMEQQISALQHQIANCDKCHKLEGELASLVDENKILATDVDMMKTLVYRLNVQIERYQDYLRMQTPAEEKPNQNLNSRSSFSQWQQEPLHTHTLSPLLQAYDEMIRDKEDLIQQYTQEFEHFAGEFKTVLTENTRLQQEIENLKRDSGNWREERARLNAQLDICRQKAESQTQKTDLVKEKLVEVMHCYEQKVQTLALEMEHLHGAYNRCKAELASLKSMATLPQDTITTSLQECKELLEQLRQQHTTEKLSLERTIDDLNEKYLKADVKIDKLKNDNSKLKLELEESTSQTNDLRKRNVSLQRSVEKVMRSRDRLKARLRIALQWGRKLEEGQDNLQSTWDALKRLETIVKHKEAQIRGMHARHLEEVSKYEKILAQKEETIKNILRDRLLGNTNR